jgi:hypothetical protein
MITDPLVYRVDRIITENRTNYPFTHYVPLRAGGKRGSYCSSIRFRFQWLSESCTEVNTLRGDVTCTRRGKGSCWNSYTWIRVGR